VGLEVLGFPVGKADGVAVVGDADGFFDGRRVGVEVGFRDGLSVVGAKDGLFVGLISTSKNAPVAGPK